MSRFQNRVEVANKVDWEGGFDHVLDWGLRVEDLPVDDKELREAWRELEITYLAFQQASDEVIDLLPEPYQF